MYNIKYFIEKYETNNNNTLAIISNSTNNRSSKTMKCRRE